MRTIKIPRFADLNINATKTGRVSANVKHESNTPKSSASTVKKVSANELFGSGPIDHDAHTNCSCHPKE